MSAPLLRRLLDMILPLILARRSALPRKDRRENPETGRLQRTKAHPPPPNVIRITEVRRSWRNTATVAGENSSCMVDLQTKPFSRVALTGAFGSPALPASIPPPGPLGHRLIRRGRASLLAGCLALQAGAAIAGSSCADVALVLAIDGSASIDATEFDLQTRGYHSALTDPRILDVFATAGVVDIAAVFWADSGFKPQIIPFQRITSGPEAARFARTLVDLDREISGNTDIAKGLSAALDLLDRPGRCAERMLIDVSSDGRASLSSRTTPRGSLSQVRARADEMGVVINALVIDTANDNLADYYRRNVAVGSRSFVMDISTFETFHTAIAAKLMRELLSGLPGNLPCVRRGVMAGSAATGCRARAPAPV